MSEHLTLEAFKKEIFDFENEKEWKFKGELPAIIDFYAEWCGPCKMLGPALEKIAEKYDGKIKVYKVDTDREPELSGLFQVQSVPTMLFIPRTGDPRFAMGALPERELDRVVNEVLLPVG